MTGEQKLLRLKVLLGDISDEFDSDVDVDTVLSEYLAIAKDEILNWLYIRVGAIPENVVDVPARYEQVQIFSVLEGFNIRGAEGQSIHIENGMHRHFVYDDMIKYIHSHVAPYVVIPQ